MAWLTRLELEARFGTETISDLETGGAVALDAIADAEAEAASYLAQVATLPLAVVPDTLKRIVAIIARYNLWRRETGEDHPAYIAYKDALRELRGIADGSISLPLGGGTGEAVTAALTLLASERIYTDAAMEGMAI